MLETRGAVAVITGGGSGIGEAIAKAWVQHGGKVVLADVLPEGLSRAEREIRAMGGEVVTTLCDVTREADNEALAALAGRTYGAINLVFYLVMLLAGFLGGAHYLLGTRLHLKLSQSVGLTAGGLYGADLIGSALGSLLVSFVCLPAWGIGRTHSSGISRIDLVEITMVAMIGEHGTG